MQQVKNFDALPDGRLGAKKSAPEKRVLVIRQSRTSSSILIESSEPLQICGGKGVKTKVWEFGCCLR